MLEEDECAMAVRVLLHAVAAASLDIEAKKPLAAKAFLDHLRFHVQYVAGLIPRTHEAHRAATEELYASLLEARRSLNDRLNSIPSEEFVQGLETRQKWEDIYRLLDFPGAP